jgi:hypothetical protein
MDVAGIIAELRSVLKGIEEGIRFLEQYPPGAHAPETAARTFAGIETQRTKISATPAAPRRKKARCRRAGANE